MSLIPKLINRGDRRDPLRVWRTSTAALAWLLTVLLVATACSAESATGEPDTGESSTTASATTAAELTTTAVPVLDDFDGEAAVGTVEAYYAAYAAGDVDGAMSHFSTDPAATITFCFVVEGCDAPGQFSMEAQRHLIAHNVAEGMENRDLSCELAGVTEDSATVRCEFEQRTAQAIAVSDPGVPTVAIATVGPSGILTYQRQIGPPDYSVVDDPFLAWMRTNHFPDVSSVECCGWASVDDARMGGEASRRFAEAWATFLEVTGCSDADYECPRIADPAGVIEAFIAAYNAGNVDTMLAFFNDDTVITDHPFAAETTGRDALRALNARDRAAAAESDPYTISNIVVDGDTVTWDHVWRSASGEEFCGVGHTATIADGRIVGWQWPSDPGPCDDS